MSGSAFVRPVMHMITSCTLLVDVAAGILVRVAAAGPGLGGHPLCTSPCCVVMSE